MSEPFRCLPSTPAEKAALLARQARIAAQHEADRKQLTDDCPHVAKAKYGRTIVCKSCKRILMHL